MAMFGIVHVGIDTALQHNVSQSPPTFKLYDSPRKSV
jgi:hypothetical protein